MDQRRLNPLYEALEAGNHKQALKIATSLLVKSPEWPMAMAMRALVLMRLHRVEEGLAQCERTAASAPSDMDVLNMLLHAYQAGGRVELAAATYEAAWAKHPTNEELGKVTFNVHVRLRNFARQQQIAMQMYKRHGGSERYLMWAVTSILLQVRGGGEARLLQLAETLLRRAPSIAAATKAAAAAAAAAATSDGGAAAPPPEICELLVLTLQQQGAAGLPKLVAAVSEGAAGILHAHLPAQRRERLLADANFELQQWESAQQAYVGLLRASPDDWTCAARIMDCGEKLNELEASRAVLRELLDAEIARAAQSGSAGCRRGPFLAQLEFEKRKGGPDIRGLLCDYFERFGAKPCCFDDMKPYLAVAVPRESEAALAFCKGLPLGIPSRTDWLDSDRPSELAVWRHTCVCRAASALGVLGELLADQDESLPACLAAHYTSALRVHQPDLVETELRVYDRYVPIVIAEMLRADGDVPSTQTYIQTTLFLLAASSRSPNNFKLKLMLIMVYFALEAFEPAWKLWQTLRIRHIQLDTLMYITLPSAMSLGCHDECNSMYQDTLRLRRENNVEVAEQAITAYNHHYWKVPEMMDFQAKVRSSWTNVSVSAANAAMAWSYLSSGTAADALANLEKLRDESIRGGGAPQDWLEPSSELTHNEDAAVLDFLCDDESSPLSKMAKDQFDPLRSTLLAEIELECLVARLLRVTLRDEASGLEADEGDGTIANTRALLERLRACVQQGWAPSLCESWAEGTVEAAEVPASSLVHAIALAWLEAVPVCRHLARDTSSLEQEFADVATHPLNFVAALNDRAVSVLQEAATIECAARTVRCCAVLPALLVEVWARTLPSKKAKRSKQPSLAAVRVALRAAAQATQRGVVAMGPVVASLAALPSAEQGEDDAALRQAAEDAVAAVAQSRQVACTRLEAQLAKAGLPELKKI